MKLAKRVLAVMLAVLLAFGNFSTVAFAASGEPVTGPAVTEPAATEQPAAPAEAPADPAPEAAEIDPVDPAPVQEADAGVPEGAGESTGETEQAPAEPVQPETNEVPAAPAGEESSETGDGMDINAAAPEGGNEPEADANGTETDEPQAEEPAPEVTVPSENDETEQVPEATEQPAPTERPAGDNGGFEEPGIEDGAIYYVLFKLTVDGAEQPEMRVEALPGQP